MRTVLLAILVALASCGASDQQIASAKTAQYQGTASQLMDIAIAVTQETYKLGEVDGAGHRFTTAPQFYSAEGGRQSAGAGGMVSVGPGSVELQLLVEVLPTEGGLHAVVVTPVTLQVLAGSPQPRELAPTDPNLPGWVLGRVDELKLKIYEAAKSLAAPPKAS